MSVVYRELALDSCTIAWQETDGAGTAVVLLHGNSSSSEIFRHQLHGRLGQKYRLLAPDLPGHGRSSDAADPLGTYSLAGYAAVVSRVLAELALPKLVVVGHSLGGHIMLRAMGGLENLAGAMIFGAPPLSGNTECFASAFRPHPGAGLLFKGALSEDEVRGFGALVFDQIADIPAFAYDDVRRTDPHAREQLGASLQAGDYGDETQIIAHSPLPLAVLHGERDGLINGDYVSSLDYRQLWQGRMVTFPGCGHSPHWQAPDVFDETLDTFVTCCTEQ